MDAGSQVAMWTFLGGVIIAIGSVVATLLTTRHRTKRESRADVVGEWKGYADRLELRVDGQQKQISELTGQVFKLHEEVGRCHGREGELKATVQLLESSVRRMQGLAGDEPPATVAPAIIVAGLDGKIRQASPPITPLLHYMTRELVGRSVEVLIPERYLEAHRAGMAKLRAGGPPPWTERTVIGHAIAKGGGEVPVAVTLHAWQDAGEWLISAEMIRRTERKEVNNAPG